MDIAKNELTALSLYQLLGAPLHALVEAEIQAAEATAEFISRFGFIAPPPDKINVGGNKDLGKLRMASFSHQKEGPDGKKRTLKVDVPFLSLLPIPALQIKDAEFDFYLKIVDTCLIKTTKKVGSEEEQNQSNVGSEDRTNQSNVESEEKSIEPLDFIDLKTAIGRDPSSASNRRSTEVHMKVKVRVEQADIPEGLAKLFNLLGENISTTEELAVTGDSQ